MLERRHPCTRMTLAEGDHSLVREPRAVLLFWRRERQCSGSNVNDTRSRNSTHAHGRAPLCADTVLICPAAAAPRTDKVQMEGRSKSDHPTWESVDITYGEYYSTQAQRGKSTSPRACARERASEDGPEQRG